jgi:hypothetical protein
MTGFLLPEFRNQVRRFKPNRIRQIQELNYVNASQIALDVGHETLLAPKTGCYLGLSQMRPSPCFNKQPYQELMAVGMQGVWHNRLQQGGN